MENLLLELIGAILEPVLHGILELIATVVADLILRGMGEIFADPVIQNVGLAYLGYLLFGLAVGAISLGLFPNHFFHPSRIHGISMLISPVLAGLMMSAIGSIQRWREKKVTQLESFSYGFTFAFGMAVLRLFAK